MLETLSVGTGWPDWPIFSQFRETGKFEKRLAGKFLAWEILKNWPKIGKFGHPWETCKNLGFFSKILGNFGQKRQSINRSQQKGARYRYRYFLGKLGRYHYRYSLPLLYLLKSEVFVHFWAFLAIMKNQLLGRNFPQKIFIFFSRK